MGPIFVRVIKLDAKICCCEMLKVFPEINSAVEVWCGTMKF